MTASSAPHKPKSEPRLPPLFAKETHLLGWHGLTVSLPIDWNLASFGGSQAAGNLRVDDADGPRLELRWEQPRGTPLLDRSIKQLLDRMEREAKKKGEAFQIAPDPHILSRKRKAQMVNFGWTGEKSEADDMVLAGQGWGAGWHCADCGRVVVAHLIGRGHEPAGKVQRLANEVLVSLECHSSGGWQRWSVFDLQLDVPEEFQLDRAKLMTGRLELDWLRPRRPGLFAWMQRDERLSLTRLAAANVLLEDEELDPWSENVLVRPHKKLRFGVAEETTVRGHAALLRRGSARNLRKFVADWLLDLVLRRRTPSPEMRVWHCEPSNKIFMLMSELSKANAHVTGDVLDSLECHR